MSRAFERLETPTLSERRQRGLKVNLSVAGFTFSTDLPFWRKWRQNHHAGQASSDEGRHGKPGMAISGDSAAVDEPTSRYTPLEQLQLSVAASALGAQLRAAGEPGPVDDLTWLRSWLEQSAGNPGNAIDSLNAHLQWRRHICSGPGGRVEMQQIPNQLSSGKAFISSKCSPSGKPVVFVLGKRHFATSNKLEYLRLLAYTIDKALMTADTQANPQRLLHAVIDLSGIGVRNLDAATLKALFDTIAYHYPSHLDVFWFVNAPLIFNGLWRIINPIIHPVVRHKVRFTRMRNGSCHELVAEIGSEALPEYLGGNATLVPVESVAILDSERTTKESHGSSPTSITSMENCNSPSFGQQLVNDETDSCASNALLILAPTRPALSPLRLCFLGSAVVAIVLVLGVLFVQFISRCPFANEPAQVLTEWVIDVMNLYLVFVSAMDTFSLTHLLLQNNASDVITR